MSASPDAEKAAHRWTAFCVTIASGSGRGCDLAVTFNDARAPRTAAWRRCLLRTLGSLTFIAAGADGGRQADRRWQQIRRQPRLGFFLLHGPRSNDPLPPRRPLIGTGFAALWRTLPHFPHRPLVTLRTIVPYWTLVPGINFVTGHRAIIAHRAILPNRTIIAHRAIVASIALAIAAFTVVALTAITAPLALDRTIVRWTIAVWTITVVPIAARAHRLAAHFPVALRLPITITITLGFTITLRFALADLLTLIALFAIIVAVRCRIIFEVVTVLLVAAARALLVEARARFAQHAEIMVGKLEVIFGLHPVAGKLRVARHALVLLVQLRGIAPLALVARITAATPAGHARGLLPTATTTAPITATVSTSLAIVDQIHSSSSHSRH